jgi:hypothetical protein
MSVAPYSNDSTRNRRSRRNQKVTDSFAAKKAASSKKVATFQRSIPNELKTILRLEKASLVLMSGLILTTLGIYAWAVYAPKMWSKDYKKLERLQSDERSLIANNEALKNYLANSAKNPANGFTEVRPFQSIFLPSTKVSKPKDKKEQKPATPTLGKDPETPVSY